MKRLFFVLISLVIPWMGYMQNLNVDYYRFGARPSPIPKSLLGFNNVDQEIYFGISDPGLDSTTAILQATKRAKALMALSKGVKVKNLTTGFDTEYWRSSSGSYESMIELEAVIDDLPDAVIIDSSFTSFNEALVLITAAETSDPEFTFSFNRYYAEYQLGGYREYSEILDLYLKDKNTPGETTVYIKSYNTEEVFTEIENKAYPLPVTHYQYLNPGDTLAQTFRYGLWINCLRKLNEALGEYSRLQTEQVRRMSEDYNSTTEKLDLGVSLNRFTFRIHSIHFKDGEIYFELKVKPY